MKTFRILMIFSILLSLSLITEGAGEKLPLVGESEKVFALASGNEEIRGLACDDVSKDSPALYVLDRSGKIYRYSLSDMTANELPLLDVLELPQRSDGKSIKDPRGLAFALEEGKPVLYFLNWHKSDRGVVSELWKYNAADKTAVSQEISLYTFNIGDRETLDVAYNEGKIYVSFDGSGYLDQSLRVRRGIIQMEWDQAYDSKLEFVKHLPDSGIAASRGLAYMKFEGARYLWGTVGDEFVYSADAATGRGLFRFDRPKSTDECHPYWGLAFGNEALWVPEGVSGVDRVHRVNVTKNLDASYKGPRIVRHLIMTIETNPERDVPDAGIVYHYYSRPYSSEQMGNMGVWPKTEKFSDESDAPNAAAKNFTYDPADDKSSRQHMALVQYDNAPARSYSSRYEVDIWTNAYRKYVYPHRVNTDISALAGTDYLADDPELFNLADKDTYDSFIQRVKDYIEERYGVPADMKHPYWAVRNALEYIQDHYYYPGRPKRKPAAVDYERHHYDANPGNLKIDLSRNPYDKSQITACSGTSVMLAGAMRYLGIHARWLGTGTQKGPKEWDANENGLLDKDEMAPVSSGHRYTQVWLGSNYGWICFDATPVRPPFNDYDPHPPAKPQWWFMHRSAAGHLKDKRIVFNVGSGLFRPLYRDFEYDEKLAVDNNCGGDQRYNLQGRFDKPELWKLARQRIYVKNPCFVTDILQEGPKNQTKVSWQLKGGWHMDPEARLSVYLQKLDPETGKPAQVALLASGIPHDAGQVVADLSAYNGQAYRILICKDGDAETGGLSETFDLD